jgi:hypothetical protein
MSETITKPAIVEDCHLEYLDELRESAVTNMFGAGPYLIDKFGVSRSESHEILSYWMKTFSARRTAKAASPKS